MKSSIVRWTLTLLCWSAVAMAQSWSISRNAVQSEAGLVMSLTREPGRQYIAYHAEVFVDLDSEYARIYIPVFGAEGVTIEYQVIDATYDSLFVNLSYGVSAGFGDLFDIYTIETLQDSALFWYKGNGRRSVNMDADYFPNRFLVIDIGMSTQTLSDWDLTTIIDVFVRFPWQVK